MYTREEAKALVDKVIALGNAAKADSTEVSLTGGERSGTRWANSSITTNLVQYDRDITATVRFGQKQGNANTRDFTDAGLKKMMDEAVAEAQKAKDNENLPALLGPQEYIPVDGALPSVIAYGPAERGRMVKDSIDLAEKMGVLGAGYIPKNDITTCNANSKGLFAYYRSADTGFSLTCRMPDGSGSGWAGTTGVKDIKNMDAKALTAVAANKAIKSRKAKAIEPGRYTVILEPRANARFLSLLLGIFNPNGGFGGGGGGGAGGGGGGGGGGGLFGGQPGSPASYMHDKKVGDKLFSDLFTLKSDIGNSILRETTIGPNDVAAKPVTWVEKGVLKAFGPNQGANTNQTLVMEGTDLSIEDMVKQTRRGLLITQFWYIRGVPSQEIPLLNTGMTRDGLFLIENGEIVGPVQNFRWNMSPIQGYANLSLVGKSEPMETGEAFGAANAALVPPVRIEEFYMTSISPAI